MNKFYRLTTCFTVFFCIGGLQASPLEINSSTLSFSHSTQPAKALHELKLKTGSVSFNSDHQTPHIKEVVHHHLSTQKLKVVYLGDGNAALETKINMTGVREATHISVVEGGVIELHGSQQAAMLVKNTDPLPGAEKPRVAQIHPKLASKAHPKLASKAHPKLASKAHPKLASKAHPKLASKTHPKLASKAHPKLASKAHPKLASKAHPKLASKGHPKLASKGHPKLASKGHPKLASKGHPKIVSKGHPKIIL